jgi:hypothetical protein
MGRSSAFLRTTAPLACALMMCACGEPLFPTDHVDVVGLAYDPDGALVVSTTDVLLFLGPDRRERERWNLGAGPSVQGLASNSSLVVGWDEGYGDGSAFLIDRTAPEKPVRFVPHVATAGLTADGRLAVASRGNSAGTRVGDPATDSWLELSPQGARALAVSADGKAVIAAFGAVGPPLMPVTPAKLVAFDGTTGAVLWNSPLDLANLALSSDGSILVGLSGDPALPGDPAVPLTLVFASANDGVEIRRTTVAGYQGTSPLSSRVPLAVSRTGASVAVTVWELATHVCQTIVIQDGKVAHSLSCLISMAFSPDDTLLTGGANGDAPHVRTALVSYDRGTGAEVDRRSFPRSFF